MKKILGLDLGTNSIGWAVVLSETDAEGCERIYRIESAGSRIIPMDAATLGDFDKGNLQSQTSERTSLRSARRLIERRLLRRERLHRVLSKMNFLPNHYNSALDRYGKFINHSEPKPAWVKQNDGKYHFLFMDSFQEMVADFAHHHPELQDSALKIPYDWTLYYLRKKALTQAVTREELSWILLSFNQKRGYYQLRDEKEEDTSNKQEEFYALRVVDVEDSGERKGKDIWYNVKLENGWIYRRTSNTPLTEWIGQVKEFIVTTTLNNDGTVKTDKDGMEKRSFRMPKPEDWMLLKKKTEMEIGASHKQVGEFIYDMLIENPKLKIKGNLIATIDRRFYKEELTLILKKQMEYIPELKDRHLYQLCIEELYPSNEAHKREISSLDFVYLFRDDILFYQRPLKTKKSLIADCPYEDRIYKDKKTGELKHTGIKCIPKSHPLFQEFRLWQFISNLRIYEREKMVDGKLRIDVDVTNEFLPDEEAYTALFDWLNSLKQITQDVLLKYSAFRLGKNQYNLYRWNYVEDKSYPCNETHAQLVSYMKKAKIADTILSSEFEMQLWHILYSVTDRRELHCALTTFAHKHNLPETFVEVIEKIPTYEHSYGSYSEKAIKKLLPLMRMGKHWKANAIDAHTCERIEKIYNGECDETIRDRVRNKAMRLTSLSDFRGLPLWLACYIVYDRHSEAKDISKWKSPQDIDNFLMEFKQYSLRNPIVEQIILETLRTVRDIWKKEGNIDEIHVELGREMKSPNDKRAKITQQARDNENTNLRIKALLLELMNPEYEIENLHAYSPSHQEIMRIYEDTVLHDETELPDDISSILKKFNETDVKKRPTSSDIMRYKLWLEQHYFSPYTGKPIPLAKLFTPAYEIEHIIPRKRYFDDSLSNKVICESAVNKLKKDMLGYEFIQSCHGQKVTLGYGRSAVEIFSVEDYERFVKEHYSHNKQKMNKLLAEDIPEDFVQRQLNDSRYISKYIKMLLSNIVRTDDEQEETSKNVITCNGSITDRLKKDWGLNDVWNKIVLPRFERLNEMTSSTDYTTKNTSGQIIPTVPLDKLKGFNKKRIDHRHHAMDAIAIACANRNIVNFLNNSNAAKEKGKLRYDLQTKLCTRKQIINKPWNTFTEDAYKVLSSIVVSFKQNLRVINKAINKYEHYNKEGKKVMVKQTQGVNWAIRKPMHKDTVYGEVNLQRIKTVSLKDALVNIQSVVDKDLKRQLQLMVKSGYDEKRIKKYLDDNKDMWCDVDIKRIKVYYFTKDTKDRFFASRKLLDESFNEKKIKGEVTDTAIQKILLNHLYDNANDPNLAFSPEGIERMNKDIQRLNDGKQHQPIMKVRIYEKADKFPVGKKGNKSSKFVEAAKGTNLFFAVYESEKTNKATGKLIKERSYASIPLNEVIERQKNGLPSAPKNEKGQEPIFVLSPNDLVYLPTTEEIEKKELNYPLDNNRIYKMVSSSGNQCFFLQEMVSNSIVYKKEFSSLNKMERAITGEMIKETCIPIKINRLGQLIE